MATILSIGMNHQTSSVELRECLATDPENARKVLDAIRNLACIHEGLFLSTCNRVEALVTTDETKEARKTLISLLAGLGNVSQDNISESLYVLRDSEAVRHIFRVASSLDSMVVGEPQILGQIKEAYRQATRHKTSGVVLNRLMHRAFHTAKRVRTETEICGAAVSISFAAVELAKKIFYPLDDKKVLLVGAGEMAELACKHLMSHGVGRMVVANRTFEKGVQLADRFGAVAVGFEEIGSQLIDADIVVASTAFPGYVVTHEMVKNSLRKRRSRPLFFVDIAVPRDVEPDVNSLSNVYVYDMDDLKGVVDLNKEQRQQEAIRAERIVKEEVVKFEKWLDTLSVVPTIVSLREKADSIIQAELKKSASALTELTPAQMRAVQILTRSIAEKVISDPILFLKKKADRPVVNAYLDVTRKLFGLDDNGGNMDS